MKPNWTETTPVSITVCDRDGKIVEMNAASRETFTKYGGEKLLGQSLYDCHNENSGRIIRELMDENRSNIYMIERGGKRQLICQLPYQDGDAVGGLVEIFIDLPENMPTHKRGE